MSIFEERFWAKVDQRASDECWEWTGARSKDGYGNFWVDGRSTLAHRFSYALAVGVSPEGNVLHSCDNPPCVNPAHLFLGDQAANVADAIAKGRWGHRGPFHKLSPEIHEEIVRLYTAGDVSQSALARRFGVSQATISHIVRSHPDYVPLSYSEAGRLRTGRNADQSCYHQLREEHAEVWTP